MIDARLAPSDQMPAIAADVFDLDAIDDEGIERAKGRLAEALLALTVRQTPRISPTGVS